MAEPEDEKAGTGRLVTIGTGDASYQVWVPNGAPDPVAPTGRLVTIGTGDASFAVDTSEIETARATLNSSAVLSPDQRERLQTLASAGTSTTSTTATTSTSTTSTGGSPVATVQTEVQQQQPSPVFSQGGEERAEIVSGQVLQNITSPTLPQGAIQTATPLEGGPEQLITGTQQTTGIEVQPQQAAALSQMTPEQITATQIDPVLLTDAARVDPATGLLPEEFTTSGRLQTLLESGEEEGIPAFAAPALAKVDRILAQRGIARSSIGHEQLTNMLITAAIPLAQADSVALVQNFSQNLNNEQQAAMANAGFKQQAMLSNQSAQNAAAQFNASSQAQTDQFMASLKSTIEKSNADRITATSHFNAQQENALTQFSKQLEFNRDQFNTTNSIAIEQSNVAWRRDMNKINTQATNAVNQANAMNSFNMSNQALTFMWQELRDAAKWSFEASQNDKQRAASLAQAALGNEAATDASKVAQFTALGSAALNLWAKAI